MPHRTPALFNMPKQKLLKSIVFLFFRRAFNAWKETGKGEPFTNEKKLLRMYIHQRFGRDASIYEIRYFDALFLHFVKEIPFDKLEDYLLGKIELSNRRAKRNKDPDYESYIQRIINATAQSKGKL